MDTSSRWHGLFRSELDIETTQLQLAHGSIYSAFTGTILRTEFVQVRAASYAHIAPTTVRFQRITLIIAIKKSGPLVGFFIS